MPKRPPEHRLEEQSHDAFRRALGDRFLYRREVPDYSVDGEVEEFDVDDRATGLRFYVQVKSTRKASLKRALAVSVPLETATYYRSLPLPLLMVLYHKPSESIYARWFHQFDPYYGGVGKKSITFKWLLGDALIPEELFRLGSEARAFLSLRSANLQLPMTFHLDAPAAGALALTKNELMFAMRAAVIRRPDILRLSAEPGARGSLQIMVRNDLLRANLADVATATIHLDRYEAGAYGEQLATDAMVCTALAFEHLGQADLASRLAAPFLPESSIILAPEVTWALSASYMRSRRLHESLAISEALDKSDDPDRRAGSIFFALPLLGHGGPLSPVEFEAFVRTYDQRILRRKEEGDDVGAGRESYNLANLLRRNSRPEEALRYYERAAQGDPGYLERSYFWHEKAGVLFGSHNYPEAAEAYARAFQLGKDPFALALGADALMFAGRYEEALKQFQGYNQKNEIGDEWRLKELFLEVLVEQFHTPCQERDPRGALKRGEQINFEAAPSEIAAALDGVLQIDALEGGAWFNLGKAHLELSKDEAALVDYLAAALCLECDAEAWVAALIQGLVCEKGPQFIQDIVTCGARMAGDRFRRQLVEWSRTQTDHASSDELLGIIDLGIAQQEAERDESFALRFHDDDGGTQEFPIRPSSEEPA
jgi:tetratricopeptide (TPR) repeat protein